MMNTKGANEPIDKRFFSQGSLVCRQASPHCVDHSLGGSRANRYTQAEPYTRAPQEPTQMRVLNDTSNLLELPLALRQGRHNNPSQEL
jgi:hypothetical protein